MFASETSELLRDDLPTELSTRNRPAMANSYSRVENTGAGEVLVATRVRTSVLPCTKRRVLILLQAHNAAEKTQGPRGSEVFMRIVSENKKATTSCAHGTRLVQDQSQHVACDDQI